MKNLMNMLLDDSGAAAAEYALILAIVGSGIALAAWNLGKSISTSMNATATKITTCSADASQAGC